MHRYANSLTPSKSLIDLVTLLCSTRPSLFFFHVLQAGVQVAKATNYNTIINKKWLQKLFHSLNETIDFVDW